MKTFIQVYFLKIVGAILIIWSIFYYMMSSLGVINIVVDDGLTHLERTGYPLGLGLFFFIIPPSWIQNIVQKFIQKKADQL